jgi:polysaccharide export outer membrane protein
MVRSTWFSLLCGLILAAAFSGCTSPDGSDANGLPPGLLDGPSGPADGSSGPDTVRIGDPVVVRFTDNPNPEMLQMVVREDGTISLPLGVVVTAAGKKKADLEQEIHRQYVPRYYVRLKVGVEVGERLIFVGGQVRVPGRYPFTGDMTVLKAIKVAGDFTEFANRRKIVVTRSDRTKVTVDGKKAEDNPELDLPVLPGDKIEVRKKIW